MHRFGPADGVGGFPQVFLRVLETMTDVANALVDSELPVPSYGEISEIPSTGPGTPHTPESLTHIDCYMDDVISVVQGGQAQLRGS